MTDKPSEINPLLAIKLFDEIADLIEAAQKGEIQPNKNLTRSEIKEIINEMHRMRQASKLVLNFGKNGGIFPEVQLKGAAAVNYLLNKGEKQ